MTRTIALAIGIVSAAGLAVRAQDHTPPPLPGWFVQPGPGETPAGVIGGPHDFTAFGGSACSACHIAHVQAIRPVATATQPATQPEVETFRIPGQRRVFIPGWYTPGPTSLLCLGCHDGTVAMSTLGSSHSMLAGVREGFDVAADSLSRDHPIGVPYPAEPNEYRPMQYVLKMNIPLPEGTIECISCHDPHNMAGIEHLLRVPNRRSALCLTCHRK